MSIIRHDRETQAIALRKGGANFKQIGEAMGFTEQRAHALVTRVLKRMNEKLAETADEVRRMETERLDAMLLTWWTRAIGGKTTAGKIIAPDIRAGDMVLRIMARRAKLWGLDAPEKLELAGKDGNPIQLAREPMKALSDEDLDALLEGFRAHAALAEEVAPSVAALPAPVLKVAPVSVILESQKKENFKDDANTDSK